MMRLFVTASIELERVDRPTLVLEAAAYRYSYARNSQETLVVMNERIVPCRSRWRAAIGSERAVASKTPWATREDAEPRRFCWARCSIR